MQVQYASQIFRALDAPVGIARHDAHRALDTDLFDVPAHRRGQELAPAGTSGRTAATSAKLVRSQTPSSAGYFFASRFASLPEHALVLEPR
jgi:hypothetical protein